MVINDHHHTPRKNDSHPPSLQKLLNVSFEKSRKFPRGPALAPAAPRRLRRRRRPERSLPRLDRSTISAARPRGKPSQAVARALGRDLARDFKSSYDRRFVFRAVQPHLPTPRSLFARISPHVASTDRARARLVFSYRPLPPRAQSQMLSSPPSALTFFFVVFRGFFFAGVDKPAPPADRSASLFATRAAFFVVSSESTAVFVAPLACASAAPATILGHARSSACPCRSASSPATPGAKTSRRIATPRRARLASPRLVDATRARAHPRVSATSSGRAHMDGFAASRSRKSPTGGDTAPESNAAANAPHAPESAAAAGLACSGSAQRCRPKCG